MIQLELAVIEAKLVFRPLKKVRLEGWSGVYAGKLVYDAFTRAGCVVDRGGFFRVTPVRSTSGALAGGWLAAGEAYSFAAYIWGVERTDYARCLLQGIVDTPNPIEVVEATITERRLQLNLPETVEELRGGSPTAAVYGVKHLPTFYRFHGAVIAYPSPRRMLASAARRLLHAIGDPEAAGEAAKTLYQATVEAAEHLELYRDETRRQRIRISHGKDQPVFHGYAEYYTVAPSNLNNLIHQLLQAARLLGLGGSPGLGLGHIDSLKQLKPRHQPPPPTQQWWEEPEAPDTGQATSTA